MDANVAGAFGEVLRALRIERKLTQEQLGLRAGLQRKYISLLELGAKAPSLATVLHIAKALDVDPGELVSLVASKIKPSDRA